MSFEVTNFWCKCLCEIEALFENTSAICFEMKKGAKSGDTVPLRQLS